MDSVLNPLNNWTYKIINLKKLEENLLIKYKIKEKKSKEILGMFEVRKSTFSPHSDILHFVIDLH